MVLIIYNFKMKNTEELSNAEKIFEKISEAQRYEGIYYRQAWAAYDIYSNSMRAVVSSTMASTTTMQNFIAWSLNKQQRSNIYYSNIETLKGLVLPQLPSMSVILNAAKKTEPSKDKKEFYDVCVNILSTITKNIVADSFKDFWDYYKLDYLITGRGVLWVESNVSDEEKENKENNKEINITHVRWQDYCQDTKPTWQAVNWVARRLLYSKRQFCTIFNVPDDDVQDGLDLSQIYADVSFTQSFNDLTTYVEVWEYWDKQTKRQYFVSRQYRHDADEGEKFLIKKIDRSDVDESFFFPTPCPPVVAYNGFNLIPMSDVWSYYQELQELNDIASRRSSIVHNLHLRGYADMATLETVNALKTVDGDEKVVAIPGFKPTPQEPLIYYVDNNPRLQLLEQLQKEHDVLTQRIYAITGISEQMRNVTSLEDDETATSIRTKTKFGSRRLKEHQQRLLNYWERILKIVMHRVCSTFTKKEYKEMFAYTFRDSVHKDIQDIIFRRTDLQKQLAALQEQQQQVAMQQAPMQQPMPQDNSGGSMPSDQSVGLGGEDAGIENQQILLQSNQGQAMPAGQPPQDMPPQDMPPQDMPPQDMPQDAPMPEQPMPQIPQAQAPVMSTGSDIGGTVAPVQALPDISQLQAQEQQIQQQLQSLDSDYDELTSEITWQRIEEFLKKDKLISFLVMCSVDDLENKLVQDEKKNSDIEFMNLLINSVNQVIANVQSNPKFADIYCSVFSLSLDNFDQTKSQREGIDEFLKDIKEVATNLINNPPQPQVPPPTPDDQKKMAEVGEIQMKTQLLQAQIAEINAKIQSMQQPTVPSVAADAPNDKLQEIQLQHQNDMELQQAKIQADQSKYKEKMESDRQLLNMKIQADKERYQEKIKADYLDNNLNNPDGAPQL